MMTYREYLRDRANRLREDYPDSTPAERRDVLTQCESEWLRTIANLPREAIVPMKVGRSLVDRIGHSEASRTLRHVANFPACLPRRA